MTDGQTLTIPELQQQARQALDGAGRSQSDAARALGVNRATISKALNRDDASGYVQTLRRIVEEHTAFTVSSEPQFEVQRKAEG